MSDHASSVRFFRVINPLYVRMAQRAITPSTIKTHVMSLRWYGKKRMKCYAHSLSNMVEVFKAYDIRGLSPEQINTAFARRLGKTLAVRYPLKKVMVGRDMRTTSYALEAALIDGFTSSGVNVV